MKKESEFSKHTLLAWHLRPLYERDYISWLFDHTNTFLYSVRDPISRFISAYNFHRKLALDNPNQKQLPKSSKHRMFYEICFPDGVESMINSILRYIIHNETEKNKKTKCYRFGIRTLLGKSSAGGLHMNHDHRHYMNCTIPRKPNHSIAVLRTEYLWDDIIDLDIKLGGKGSTSFPRKHNLEHGSNSWSGKLSYNKTISKSNRRILCCIMYQEYHAYQYLIWKSFNLNASTKQQSINEVLHRCQIQQIVEDYQPTDLLQSQQNNNGNEWFFDWQQYYNNDCKTNIMGETMWNIITNEYELSNRDINYPCHLYG